MVFIVVSEHLTNSLSSQDICGAGEFAHKSTCGFWLGEVT